MFFMMRGRHPGALDAGDPQNAPGPAGCPMGSVPGCGHDVFLVSPNRETADLLEALYCGGTIHIGAPALA